MLVERLTDSSENGGGLGPRGPLRVFGKDGSLSCPLFSLFLLNIPIFVERPLAGKEEAL